MNYPANSVAGDQLLAIIERVERLDEERSAIAGDISEVYKEARGNGFDVKVIKIIVRRRKQDHAELMEQEALLELYLSAIGMTDAPKEEDDYVPSRSRAPAPARAHVEIIEEFDPETGEIKPAGNGASGAEEETQVATVRAPSSANSSQPVASDQHVEANTAIGLAGPAWTADAQPANIKPAQNSEPAEGNTPTSAGHGDRGAVVPSVAPVVAANVVQIKKRWTFNDPAHRDCLDPVRCGGFSNLKLCQRCAEAAEGGQVA